LQALHRERERLVSQRTGIINQTRAFLLERGIAVRQGLRVLCAELESRSSRRHQLHKGVLPESPTNRTCRERGPKRTQSTRADNAWITALGEILISMCHRR
jgi:hypothetical protein